MRRYIGKRVAAMPLLLLAIITVTFLITRLIPANPLATVLSPRELSDPEALAAAKEHWGLSDSLLEQYLRYLRNLLHGDMGTSFVTKDGVTHDLTTRLPATIELTIAAMLIAVIGGVAIGVLVATPQKKKTDHFRPVFAPPRSSPPGFLSGPVLLPLFLSKMHPPPRPRP